MDKCFLTVFSLCKFVLSLCECCAKYAKERGRLVNFNRTLARNLPRHIGMQGWREKSLSSHALLFLVFFIVLHFVALLLWYRWSWQRFIFVFAMLGEGPVLSLPIAHIISALISRFRFVNRLSLPTRPPLHRLHPQQLLMPLLSLFPSYRRSLALPLHSLRMPLKPLFLFLCRVFSLTLDFYRVICLTLLTPFFC
ncbi:hypothetical protein BKA57DRAFT_165434 [Linnemannia elongata]|nr:hypothetical protein BKA57DRAFT_165434 [Linnemannia elongata]